MAVPQYIRILSKLLWGVLVDYLYQKGGLGEFEL